VTAYQWYGILLTAEKRFDEAENQFNIALLIDPLSLVARLDLGQAYFYAGQYDRAIDQTQQILEINPAFAFPFDLRGMAHEQQQKYPEATSDFEKYSQLAGGGLDPDMHLAHVYAVSGKVREADGSCCLSQNPRNVPLVHSPTPLTICLKNTLFRSLPREAQEAVPSDKLQVICSEGARLDHP